ncbi:MAG: MBL fold metallo-hydrolase [Phycisphaerae bacterium]
MARLMFHGAAQEVTGSMHLVHAAGQWIALDCGLFQGHRADADRKNQEFAIAPDALSAVVVSHAHTDHTGRLPLLARSGFRGPIFATPATRDLCDIMLADSAHIQQEDAEYLNRKRQRHGEPPVEPLYTLHDAETVLRLFQTMPLDRPFAAGRGVQARFFEAGHMLGSAGIELVIREEGRPPTTIVFSGDMGRFNSPILRDPAPLPPADYLICESTYGARQNPPVTDLDEQLADVMRDAIGRGGKVIVPAFSVGRTQAVVYVLARLMHTGTIPQLPVYVDSPLAVDATEVFRLHPECYDRDAREFAREAGDFLGSACCHYVRSVDESKALHGRHAPCVIISASGMCETGRILHHLKNNVHDPKNTLLFVGYQAAHTLGRRIADGERKVRIFQQDYPVRARVTQLHGFSGHADRDELLRMTTPLAGRSRTTFLVHGEPESMTALRKGMLAAGHRDVRMPQRGETVELNGAGHG